MAEALEYALTLAKALQARATLLHVIFTVGREKGSSTALCGVRQGG